MTAVLVGSFPDDDLVAVHLLRTMQISVPKDSAQNFPYGRFQEEIRPTTAQAPDKLAVLLDKKTR